jgi:hypothetical protein
MALFDQAQLNRAIAELKATTRVTMETVGVRFGRRVSTAVYREHLARKPGSVILQPPSEDRVSAFVSVDGGKPTCLKFFSTGKVRCLKSDFPNADEAERCAQSLIDDMAGTPDAGMPPIRLSDAKFNENSKDFTWSTRQNIHIGKLSAAFRAGGIKAESDTSFGDSIMVVITPPGTERNIKGQVLADGTIRLAGCRDDGELAARAVAVSLNESGALQGGPVGPAAVSCEVWLTKRSFQVCSERQVVHMDRLYAILNDPRSRHCQHPVLSLWLRQKGEQHFIKSVSKVGTACPRLEVKFAPLVIDEWEQVRRCKPEPVSISIHNKGEVQLAGNAEYKVLQAVHFLLDIVGRHPEALLGAHEEAQGALALRCALSQRTPKRTLEVITGGEGAEEPHSTPTLASAKKQRSKTETPATAVRGAKKSAATIPHPATFEYLQEAVTPRGSEEADGSGDGNAEVYHQRQLMMLAFLRMCQESYLLQMEAPAKECGGTVDHPAAMRAMQLDWSAVCGPSSSSPSPSSSSSMAVFSQEQKASSSGDESKVQDSADDCQQGSERPPVSPTGLGVGGPHFEATKATGRSTPISPAKVSPTKFTTKEAKARNRKKPNKKSWASVAKSLQGMPVVPHMLGMPPQHEQAGIFPWVAPVVPAWAPHGAPMGYPAFNSPWGTTLTTNVAGQVHPTQLPQ